MRHYILGYVMDRSLPGVTEADACCLTHMNLAFGLVKDGLLDMSMLPHIGLVDQFRRWNSTLRYVRLTTYDMRGGEGPCQAGHHAPRWTPCGSSCAHDGCLSDRSAKPSGHGLRALSLSKNEFLTARLNLLGGSESRRHNPKA